MKNHHEFVIHVGPMFASKTTAMLSRLERYELQNKIVIAFKPKIDDRYSESMIVSHSGWKRAAYNVSNGIDILRKIETLTCIPDVVALDEAFMVKNCDKALIWLFQMGVNIIVSSLDLTYKGKPFKELTLLYPWATKIIKSVAICDVCGEDAPYTYRKTLSEDEILIGGKENYAPRCFIHHPLINKIPGDYE